jgi:hypothetical protein
MRPSNGSAAASSVKKNEIFRGLCATGLSVWHPVAINKTEIVNRKSESLRNDLGMENPPYPEMVCLPLLFTDGAVQARKIA